MITPIGTFFNTAPATLLSAETDDRSTGNTASDGYLALTKLAGGLPGGYWLPPLARHSLEYANPFIRPAPNKAAEEPVEPSFFDDLTIGGLLGLAVVAGAFALIEGILLIRNGSELKKLRALIAADKSKMPPAEPKMFQVNGLKASTVTVERWTWKPEKIIARRMMQEDRELEVPKEDLERAVTAAITEWFDLPVEERDALLKDAPPEAITFAEDGGSEKILYSWVKKRAPKIYDESPKSTPPRGAQTGVDTTEPISRILVAIKDVFNIQDTQDAPTVIKKASATMAVIAESFLPDVFNSSQSEFTREKAGLLSILGEIFEFYGNFEQMRNAYNGLVKYNLLSIDTGLTRIEDFADFIKSAMPAQKFLLLGELPWYSNGPLLPPLRPDDLRTIMERVAASEPKDGPVRELADLMTAGHISKLEVTEKARERALIYFRDGQEWAPNRWENSEIVAAKMQGWRERLDKIETRIRDTQEARRSKRK